MAQSPRMDFKVNTHTLPFSLHETQSQHTGNKECFLITRHMLHIKTLEVQLHIIQLWWLCGNTHRNPLQRITTYRWEMLLDENAAATLVQILWVMKRNHSLLNSNSCYITPRRLSASIMVIVSDTEQSADEKDRSRQRKYPVCVWVRERGEKENPGGINSSYRNSSGLVSASVLG